MSWEWTQSRFGERDTGLQLVSSALLGMMEVMENTVKCKGEKGIYGLEKINVFLVLLKLQIPQNHPDSNWTVLAQIQIRFGLTLVAVCYKSSVTNFQHQNDPLSNVNKTENAPRSYQLLYGTNINTKCLCYVCYCSKV